MPEVARQHERGEVELLLDDEGVAGLVPRHDGGRDGSDTMLNVFRMKPLMPASQSSAHGNDDDELDDIGVAATPATEANDGEKGAEAPLTASDVTGRSSWAGGDGVDDTRGVLEDAEVGDDSVEWPDKGDDVDRSDDDNSRFSTAPSTAGDAEADSNMTTSTALQSGRRTGNDGGCWEHQAVAAAYRGGEYSTV